MHAGIDDLLKLRDGEHAPLALAHVRDCARCRTELARLDALSAELRELPSNSVPPERWSAIHAALSTRAEPIAANRRPGWLVPVASAALVLVAVLFTLNSRRPDFSPATETRATPVQDARRALVAESQRLESLLAALPNQPRLTRAQTALTVADLEDRIQWVDYRLNLASEAGLADEPAEKLWRERVDLLNSLVAVRYAEARTVAF